MTPPPVPRSGPPDRALLPSQVGARLFLGRNTTAHGQRWGGWPEVRADLRPVVAVVAALTVAGGPLGVAWWALAPRARFRITADGPVPLGDPPLELGVADDAVLALLLVATGLLVGGLAWLLPRRRGVAMLGGLAVGMLSAGVVAWQVGQALGVGPTEAELAVVGAVVTTPLRLAALPVLGLGPFAAVLAYVAAVLLTRAEDLGRPPRRTGGTLEHAVPDGAGVVDAQGAHR